MSDPVITIEGLRKKYQLGRSAAYGTLREAIVEAVSRPMRRKSSHEEPRDFWALDGVDLEVRRGEAVGVIGRNGAGKSTLLKVLSRITEPTAGRVTIRGRVASLLEVGTGFHSELTGRENIYLNGAILGMSRSEIARKFDAIVAFSEVEKFLDTPVKRYSSGMYVRLAFAIAACLEPEVLIVDEVLAVGDLAFQKKCLDSLKGIANGNHTVLFVSHNMAAVHALCDRCVLLDSGRTVMVGPTRDVVRRYTERYQPTARYERTGHRGDRPEVIAASLELDIAGTSSHSAVARLEITIETPDATTIAVGVLVKDQLGLPVGFASLGQFNSSDAIAIKKGRNDLAMTFPVDRLALGNYTLGIRTSYPGVAVIEQIDDCLSLLVERPPAPGSVSALEQSWGFGAVELLATRVPAGAPRRLPKDVELLSKRKVAVSSSVRQA